MITDTCLRCGSSWTLALGKRLWACPGCRSRTWDREQSVSPGRPAIVTLPPLEEGASATVPWAALVNGQPDLAANTKRRRSLRAQCRSRGWRVRFDFGAGGITITRQA